MCLELGLKVISRVAPALTLVAGWLLHKLIMRLNCLIRISVCFLLFYMRLCIINSIRQSNTQLLSLMSRIVSMHCTQGKGFAFNEEFQPPLCPKQGSSMAKDGL